MLSCNCQGEPGIRKEINFTEDKNMTMKMTEVLKDKVSSNFLNIEFPKKKESENYATRQNIHYSIRNDYGITPLFSSTQNGYTVINLR